MAKAAPQLDTAALMQDVQRAMDDSAAVWQRYTCRLLTPMYGGGVEPGVVDRLMPIRATAIRGQLRAWWRLLNRRRTEYCREGKPDSALLFAAEREIWGGLGDEKTLAASKVVVRVENMPQDLRLSTKGNSALGRMILSEARTVVNWLPSREPPVQFVLALRIDAGGESVLQALRMWASFGGLGARTRRGLGAVEVSDAQGDVLQATKDDWEAAGGTVGGMRDCFFDDYQSAVQAGVQKLIDFRQDAGLARGLGSGSRPGGSFWPEANAVRHLMRRARDKNRNVLDRAHPPPLLFPRALFGLPIVFQFKPDEKQGDPAPCALEVADDAEQRRDRFASPLIFAARRQVRGLKTCYQPIVLLLPTHRRLRAQGLKLKGSQRTVELAVGAWWPADADQRRAVTPAELREFADAKADILSTFLRYFQRGDK
ncbi:type III-B CRISPR module RAMP protein Cmr1 [Accumulibacter sp.]|uniref:type III-B CRISPR module RAMP protein Cmr1 n=3 Tax=Accumulibacter sp. TaxID=2053492 RepID=UPI002CABCBA3|nr:type III-B CRISPR module RAMP protein Cmr1 [Accumulibacter sp.]HNB69160.1 type III-B CRISPR module RAMP protein Cmr1 [Accumulibacter sp.]